MISLSTKNVEDYTQHIRDFLQILRAKKLYVNLKKCDFATTKLLFLGFIIFVETDEGKVESIKSWPTYTSIIKVRKFRDLATFYRKFIKGFLQHPSPIVSRMASFHGDKSRIKTSN